MKNFQSPKTKEELLEKCQEIEGLTFSQLASKLKFKIPSNENKRKGWVGQLIEVALGADLHTLPAPDFQKLGIELKTLPLNHLGKPAESTFVTSIPLLSLNKQTWETSTVYTKLKCVLWILIEGDKTITYGARRIGRAILWKPDALQHQILKTDWEELTTKIILGQLEEIDASYGTALQIRPKAANGKVLSQAYDKQGNKIKTLPRGFYLRTSFTQQILGQ